MSGYQQRLIDTVVRLQHKLMRRTGAGRRQIDRCPAGGRRSATGQLNCAILILNDIVELIADQTADGRTNGIRYVAHLRALRQTRQTDVSQRVGGCVTVARLISSTAVGFTETVSSLLNSAVFWIAEVRVIDGST